MEPLIPYFQVPVIHIGPLPIHGFGMLVALGFILGGNVAQWRAERAGLDREAINKLLGYLVIGTFVGGHVGYGLMYEPREYLSNPIKFLQFWQGLSSFGGFVVCVPLSFWFFRHHKLPVWPYMDSLAIGLSLGWFLGWGIGGGLIFNGQLYRGQHGLAADVGHMLVEPDGRLCGCGQRGCWEQYGSGNALVREARALAGEQRESATQLFELGDGTPEGVQGAHVTAAARAGDPVSLQAFATVGDWLGIGLANLAALLDPEGFVLGGGVSEAGDLLLGPTREAFLAHLSGRDIRPVVPEVRLAELGNDAGIVGAADLSRV